MQKYELVLLLDHSMKVDDRNNVINEIESVMKESILEKDDMGLQGLSYELGGDKLKDKAYFISYYLNFDNLKLDEIRAFLKYNKAVLRFKIFAMTKNQIFFLYDKLKQELDKEIESWGKQRFGQKITFFTNNGKSKYLNWKSIAILKKYITRFSDIKPRRYTGNSVSKQKRLRKCILNARELAMLEYVK